MATEPFNRLKDCRHGRMLYNFNDEYVGRSFDVYGEFSQGEIDFFAQIVKPGDYVVEVGANIGAHTVWFGHATWPGGGVMVFEPQRLIYQTLCANLALNNLVNVVAQQAVVGAQAGSMLVPCVEPHQHANFGGIGIDQFTKFAKAGERVPVIRLDDLRLSQCRLLKVDVEGMELEVLQGATDLIGRLKPWLYVENDRHDKAEALVKFIDSIDYHCYWHTPLLFNPNNFAGHTENLWPGIGSINMLCVPKSLTVNGMEPVTTPSWDEHKRAKLGS